MAYFQNIFYIAPHPDCYKFYPMADKLNPPKISAIRVEHPGESSRQKNVICDLWLKNACQREECGFSHSFYNLTPTPLPANYKRKPCENHFDKGFCKYRFNCNFFHRDDYLFEDGNIVTVWTPDPLNPPYWVVYRFFEKAR